MLQAYRVAEAFEAKQLRRAPLWLEAFDVGELLIVLSSDMGETTFCRHDDPEDIEARAHFVIAIEEFGYVTKEVAANSLPDSGDEMPD